MVITLSSHETIRKNHQSGQLHYTKATAYVGDFMFPQKHIDGFEKYCGVENRAPVPQCNTPATSSSALVSSGLKNCFGAIVFPEESHSRSIMSSRL
jgi:hypothetical protein